MKVDNAPSPAAAATHLIGEPGLVWLDGDGVGSQGRYSYVGSRPAAVHRVAGGRDPFAGADRVFAPAASPGPSPAPTKASDRDTGPAGCQVPHWIGAIAYDALFDIPGGPGRTAPTGPTGDNLVHFARYDALYAYDHRTQLGWVVGDRAEAPRLLERLTRGTGRRPTGAVSGLRCPSATAHRDMLASALEHIRRGDIYQANLAHAWHGEFAGDPLWLALQMRRASPVPFGAFVDMGDRQLVSRSMERFMRFRSSDRRLLTRPIKGTLARAGGRDGAEAQALRADPKERAEHAMIVDLLRNDLGRVADIGSVTVASPYTVEPYRGLSHLVSTVACRVAEDRGLSDILRATFPPGSVTGTPKRRATEIIDALEPEPRGFYCGALGYVDRAGGLSLSVGIRMAQIGAGHVRYHAGGGIVEASHPERELAETVLKARVFLDAIGHGGPPLSA